MSDCKITARVSSYGSLYVWNTRIWHHHCKGNTWKRCLTGGREEAQSQKCNFAVYLCVCVCLSEQACSPWSHLRHHTYRIRADSWATGNRVRFFFPSHNLLWVVKMQRYMCQSFLKFHFFSQKWSQGWLDKGGLVLPHRSCLLWSKLCLVLHVFLVMSLCFFCVTCSCQKTMFTSKMYFSVFKAIFFMKLN